MVVSALALLALPSAAGAASVSFDGATIQYAAAPGETNQLAIAASGTDIVLSPIPAPGRWSTSTGRAAVRSPARWPPARSAELRHHPRDARDRRRHRHLLRQPGGAITAITIDAGAATTRSVGSNGADTLLGGYGADFIDGNQGNDTAFGGTGTDTFQWDPGDGSDILEGQENLDTLRFNGTNINEKDRALRQRRRACA